MKYYKKEKVYPFEAFIQEAIEKYFSAEGYSIEEDDRIDLIAFKPDIRWIVEAKGSTSQITVDFNTCLGQLARNMTSPSIKYAIAIPCENNYRNQCKSISDYYRVINNLHIIIVDENARVTIIKPTDNVETEWDLFKSA